MKSPKLSLIFLVCLYAIFMMGFSACKRRPDGVLSDREMVSLIADMQLAEAYAEQEYGRYEENDQRKELSEGVLASHGVTREELDSTWVWYGRNLDDYTELFEKVDRELVSRKASMLKEGKRPDEHSGSDMLWPYGKHGVISTLGTSDGWVLSLRDPQLERGDLLSWKMFVKDPTQLMGLLGVEYEDGSADAVNMLFTGRQNIELEVQTDTSKTVSRVYGYVRLKDSGNPGSVFADSIRLNRLPFDSIEFGKYRPQRSFAPPVRIKDISVYREKDDSVSLNFETSPASSQLPVKEEKSSREVILSNSRNQSGSNPRTDTPGKRGRIMPKKRTDMPISSAPSTSGFNLPTKRPGEK